ncbi:hypothetical protein FOA43_002170 [Brettanomyces nanus]|uniref:Ribosomal RNA-processing protein 8 n=1 Tax=Eeniella nana TaxID=13502 RepID=A0A875S6M4_EENNA|nr:uncharacterized protein FOA43_002170 [Brettanomyces nanus]QPG74834.1 hypothetical protein FOA43_002170 [Brettanomyces nanus]
MSNGIISNDKRLPLHLVQSGNDNYFKKMPLFEIDGWNLGDNSVVPGVTAEDLKRKHKKEKKKQRKEKWEEREQEKKKRELETDSTEPEDHKRPKKSEVRADNNHDTPSSVAPPPAPAKLDTTNLTPLQCKMLNKLSGSRFRWINEQLYTADSEDAVELMEKQPELFEEYHKGFRSQVEAWPENPVDLYIKHLVFRGSNRAINSPGGLPGLEINGKKTVVVADMGCGEAKLAVEVERYMEFYDKDSKKALKIFKKKYGGDSDIFAKNKKLNFEIHSFDLKKMNDKITVADIKHVPLKNRSCSVVIFCLSLMGTNFLDFIKEANRILIPRGELWIAEIQSRLTDDKGEEFSEVLSRLGFKHKETDTSNKMFARFEFFKPLNEVDPDLEDLEDLEEKRKENKEGKWLLKPCIYKRR